MTLLDDVRLGAQRPRWEKLPPGRRTSSGVEAVELAASAGLVLDEWQCWWMDHALAERADGNWCAAENVLITGRQSGKNGCLAALELFYLFLMGDKLVIHSAHELPTAINHFNFMLDLIDASADLSKKCKRPTFTNGEQAINLRSGATLKFRARGRNSGRGLTAARLILDEAFKIPPESMGALIPTLRAMKNTQRTYASSAPKSDSVVLHELIKRGRRDDPEDRLFYAEWGNPIGTAMDDVDAWYQANPALGVVRSNGTGVTVEALEDEYRTLVSGGNEELIAEFAREAVGIGEPPPSESGPPAKFNAGRWADTETRVRVDFVPGACTLAYDVHNGWCSVSISNGSLSASYGEVIEHRKGTGWLPARMVELARKWKPSAIGLDGGNGEAVAVLGQVREAFEVAGLDPELLIPLTSAAYRAACGDVANAVENGRATRPKGDPDQLRAAGEVAAERRIGDAFVFDRKCSTPLSPLISWTIARSLLPQAAPKSKVMHTRASLSSGI
jgi:hypothetical protein